MDTKELLKQQFKQQEIRRVKEFVESCKKEILSREFSWNEVFHDRCYVRVAFQSNIPELPSPGRIAPYQEEIDLRDELFREIHFQLNQITDNPGKPSYKESGGGAFWVLNLPFSSTESQK